MIQIENDFLAVKINPAGAEMQSVYHKQHQLEYLWQGDKPWPKHSPVLFPIVGALKDDTYYFEVKAYHLSRHGFARDMVFELDSLSHEQAVFSIKSTAETLGKYPFDFIFKITYQLEANKVKVSYQVINCGSSAMYFSVGGHPAFAVPLTRDTRFEDYYLEFEHDEDLLRWPLKGNLIDNKPERFTEQRNRIDLRKNLFYRDAIVLKGLRSNSVKLASEKTPRALIMNFGEFPYFGIWSAKDADFVCLEPWHGIADSVLHNQQLTEKEGIIALKASGVWVACWDIKCL